MTRNDPAPAEWDTDHLRLAVEAARIALWSWNVDTNRFTMDELGFDLWGLPWSEAVRFEELSARIHPTDRDRVQEAFTATRSVEGPYEIDFRICFGDEVRWVSARGRGADAGIVDRVMFGIFLDVTGRKQAEEGNELLAGEMSHRVKNLLTMASSLTTLTSRSSSSLAEMTEGLTKRLSALGRAHDLVRPLPQRQGNAASFGDLLDVLLAPYDNRDASSARVRISVPPMSVGVRSATALAMVVHELATNSVKYGALSAETGLLDVSAMQDEDTVTLVWAEAGGPEIAEEPEMRGFGTRMMQRSQAGQLGGSIAYDWRTSGLVAKLALQRALLAE